MMKIIAITLKDLLRSVRSMFAVGMMLAAPLLITGLIYLAFGGMDDPQPDLPAVHIGLLNQDNPPPDKELDLGDIIITMFMDESMEDWMTVRIYNSREEVRSALERGEIDAAVLIPADLSAAVLSDRSPDTPVVILHDPALTFGPQIARDMVASLLNGVTSGRFVIQVVQARYQEYGLALGTDQIPDLMNAYQTWYTDFQRTLFHNPEEAALRLASPGNVEETGAPMKQVMGMVMAAQMIFFGFYTGAYSMMSILKEQEEGTLGRIFTTPTARTMILAGKFVAVFLTVTIQGLILMVTAHFAFSISWGQTGSVALALAGQVIAASGLGVLLIALVKSSRQAGPVLGGGLTALGMIGGLFTVSVPEMPAAFDRLSLFTPHGWVLQVWKLSLAGQPPADLLLPFIIAAGWGVAMFIAGAVFFRRRFA